MAMQVGPGGGSGGEMEVMLDINTTPLIDVMLVLIIMLIITIPIQTHAVKLDMPRPTETPPTVEPEYVDLVIDFDGTILWNGNVVSGEEQLKAYLVSAVRTNPQPEFHINPHKLVKYDHVARVLAHAQRLGIQRIGFVGNEKFLQ
jgi:biopolymer transport protein ExbD